MKKSHASLCSILGLAISCSIATGAERLVWFGTYTGGTGKSEGIYVSRFDDVAGTLTEAKLAGPAQNPTYLALHPKLPMLYAVSEVGRFEGQRTGAVLAFAFDPATGELAAKGAQSSGGAAPCHLTVDPSGKAVLAANYVGGSTICLGLEGDGRLKPVVAAGPQEPGGFIQHVFERTGEFGLNAGRQKAPHAHSVETTADGRFAIVCDLGLDRVFSFKLDPDEATLAPNGFVRVKTGAGPRRFSFHPHGRYAYAVNELDLTVTAFECDTQTGSLREIQTLSTLPADVVERQKFSCAEIVTHPSGRFLYASNRTHDSIAMYRIDAASGRLTFLGVQPIEGAMPRNFNIDPGGRFLLVGGQNSNTVAVFAIHQETGALSFTGAKVDVPSPVSIVFGRLENDASAPR
jgi:6-phosphogluconolactonase